MRSEVLLKDAPAGTYRIAVEMHDAATNRDIALPLADDRVQASYVIGTLEVTPRDNRAASQ